MLSSLPSLLPHYSPRPLLAEALQELKAIEGWGQGAGPLLSSDPQTSPVCPPCERVCTWAGAGRPVEGGGTAAAAEPPAPSGRPCPSPWEARPGSEPGPPQPASGGGSGRWGVTSGASPTVRKPGPPPVPLHPCPLCQSRPLRRGSTE